MFSDSPASPNLCPDRAIRSVPTLHWSAGEGLTGGTEEVIAEEALCLEVAYPRSGSEVIKTLGITMRTPGQDEELALGFLVGEGVISDLSEVRSNETLLYNRADERIDTRRVSLVNPPKNNLQRISRAITTTSACGLCGRGTLQGLPLHSSVQLPRSEAALLSSKRIAGLPELLRMNQTAFSKTGGCHGAALCDRTGAILLTREDVGRHNAVDKLLGAALQQRLALANLILVLSGRASFELVQKSAAGGLSIIVAVGAPSSAAVELAHAAEITLVGFTRENRFNLYTHATRIAWE